MTWGSNPTFQKTLCRWYVNSVLTYHVTHV